MRADASAQGFVDRDAHIIAAMLAIEFGRGVGHKPVQARDCGGLGKRPVGYFGQDFAVDFSNLAVLPFIIPGHSVADVVAIMGSVDPVFGEVDR